MVGRVWWASCRCGWVSRQENLDEAPMSEETQEAISDGTCPACEQRGVFIKSGSVVDFDEAQIAWMNKLSKWAFMLKKLREERGK